MRPVRLLLDTRVRDKPPPISAPAAESTHDENCRLDFILAAAGDAPVPGGRWAVSDARLALDKPLAVPGDPTALPVCVSDHAGVEATLALRPVSPERMPLATVPPATRPAFLATTQPSWTQPAYAVWPLQPLGGLVTSVPEIQEATKIVKASLLRGSTSPRRLRGRLFGNTILVALFGVVLALGLGPGGDGLDWHPPTLDLVLAAVLSGAVAAAQLWTGTLRALSSPWAAGVHGLLGAAAVVGLALWWLLRSPASDWAGVAMLWSASFMLSLAASADGIGGWVRATSSPFNGSELRSRLRWLEAIQQRWVATSSSCKDATAA